MELGAGWGGTRVLKERPKPPLAYIESITCGDGTRFTIFEKLWSMKKHNGSITLAYFQSDGENTMTRQK
jgi:hypothetical protein